MAKKTMIIGATNNEDRYAFEAAERLIDKGHPIIPIGVRKGEVLGHTIINDRPHIDEIDTITMYVGTKNQENYIDYILNLKPKRVIFNPGTENRPFEKQLQEQGIETLEACTLVMLATNQY